jgi:glycerol dehydrogenase-like iron-containing ADH family enzyme
VGFITRNRLDATPEAAIMVDSMEVKVIERQVAGAPQCDTFVGNCGSQAIDPAKYFAWKHGIRLVSIPIVRSVDAFVIPAAVIRGNHAVEHLGETSLDPLVMSRIGPLNLKILNATRWLQCFDLFCCALC